MAEQQNRPTPPNTASPNTGSTESVREGEDAMGERAGEGGYGNDTGFATGTSAPRDDAADAAAGGTSGREQQTSDTYRDAGQGHTSRDAAGGTR